jgi:anti-sigma B factor antagonist
MAACGGVIRVHEEEQAITCQVEGRATLDQGVALRRYVEQALACGVIIIRADLRHCTFMDSTFIGTLLHVKRALCKCEHGELALISPSQQCQRLLHQMGLDGVFFVMNAPEAGEQTWTELPAEPRDPCTFRRSVFQAHQELASLPGCVGDTFRQVTDTISKELQQQDAQGK